MRISCGIMVREMSKKSSSILRDQVTSNKAIIDSLQEKCGEKGHLPGSMAQSMGTVMAGTLASDATTRIDEMRTPDDDGSLNHIEYQYRLDALR